MYKKLSKNDLKDIIDQPKITALKNKLFAFEKKFDFEVERKIKEHEKFPFLSTNPLLDLFISNGVKMYAKLGNICNIKSNGITYGPSIYQRVI